jgi:Protein of unknown function (DUF3987)
MDRRGHENDRAFYCEAWNGTGAYTYDRIGRGTLHIRAACLSVLGGIQPGPLEPYLREVFAGAGMTRCSSASSWRWGPTAGGSGGTWTGGRTRRRGRA